MPAAGRDGGGVRGVRAQDAGAEKPARDDVQAAYLYNFGQFVRWPEGAGRGPMLVCVAGQDPFGQTVGKLAAGKQISGRALEVRNLDEPEGAADCSILFVGKPESGHAGCLSGGGGRQAGSDGGGGAGFSHARRA